MHARTAILNNRIRWLMAVLFALSLIPMARVNAAPPGNNGTVKVHDGAVEPDPPMQNHSHVGCNFHLHGFNFDPGQNNTWKINQQPPTGRDEVLNGSYVADEQGEWQSDLLDLPSGHYKLSVEGVKGSEKHKTFKVECKPCTGSVEGIKEDESGKKLSGWTFEVYDAKGTLVGSDVSDTNGKWGVEDLELGSYKVCEIPQPGWELVGIFLKDKEVNESGCANFTLDHCGQVFGSGFAFVNREIPPTPTPTSTPTATPTSTPTPTPTPQPEAPICESASGSPDKGEVPYDYTIDSVSISDPDGQLTGYTVKVDGDEQTITDPVGFITNISATGTHTVWVGVTSDISGTVYYDACKMHTVASEKPPEEPRTGIYGKKSVRAPWWLINEAYQLKDTELGRMYRMDTLRLIDGTPFAEFVPENPDQIVEVWGAGFHAALGGRAGDSWFEGFATSDGYDGVFSVDLKDNQNNNWFGEGAYAAALYQGFVSGSPFDVVARKYNVSWKIIVEDAPNGKGDSDRVLLSESPLPRNGRSYVGHWVNEWTPPLLPVTGGEIEVEKVVTKTVELERPCQSCCVQKVEGNNNVSIQICGDNSGKIEIDYGLTASDIVSVTEKIADAVGEGFESLSDKNAELYNKLIESVRQNGADENHITWLQDVIADMRGEVYERDQQIAALQEQITVLEDENAALKSENDDLHQRVIRLEDMMASATAQSTEQTDTVPWWVWLLIGGCFLIILGLAFIAGLLVRRDCPPDPALDPEKPTSPIVVPEIRSPADYAQWK
jgi:hypothetical protein